jgi:CTP:molybdopterin cytidylyltransferase MocA
VIGSAHVQGKRVACVVLAAGGSRRLGFPKQLVRHRGRPLLARALAAATAALPDQPLVVVLGADSLRLRLLARRVAPHARAVRNARWADGLASSLTVGLRAVPRDATAALVALVDQPLVDARALARLVAAWRRRPGLPAAAHYAGRVGVPAVLPRRTWRKLRGAVGDSGARALLRGAAALTLVRLPEAALDIDTPADLVKLESSVSRRPRQHPSQENRHL